MNDSSTGNTGRLGDPECKICGGVGYIRLELPVGHPDFGKVQICTCRQEAIRSKIREQLFSLSHLEQLKEMTFETFEPHGSKLLGQQHQASIEYAFKTSRKFSEDPTGWLLIQGRYGVGKTHLAAAIANDCVTRDIPTIFLTVPDLLDSLRHTFSSKDMTFEERFEQIRQAPLLILDDFGTQNTTDWAREKLFQILNYRYINHLPLVITTNLLLDELEGRIRSRLSDASLVEHIIIHAPDHRRPDETLDHHELSSLNVHSHQTFGTFNMRNGEKIDPKDLRTLEDAFKASRHFAESPSGWLILTGTYGCGKTHLAAAIANYRASEGFSPMFIVVPDLLDHLRSTFNPNSETSYDRRFEEVRSARLLVLDDLGTQATSPWVREKLYQLFNHRYNAQLPTVITTSERFEDLDPRLRSRMQDFSLCAVHPITVPSYRGIRPKRKKR